MCIVFPVSDHNNLISSQIMSVISTWHSSASVVMFIYLLKKIVMAGDDKIWDCKTVTVKAVTVKNSLDSRKVYFSFCIDFKIL